MKKIMLLGTTMAALTLSLMANADLVTHNNTDKYVAVKVTSGIFNGRCTGTLPGVLKSVTPPGGTTTTYWNTQVKPLCAGSLGGTCTADIYVSADCSDGTKVGTASMQLATQNVSITNIADPTYQVTSVFTGSGSDITISYSSQH